MTALKRSMLAAAMMLAPGLVNADTMTATVAVSATVVPACTTLSATPLNFGNYTSAANADATFTVTTNCVNGASVYYSISGGLNPLQDNVTKLLVMAGSAGGALQYKVYLDAARINAIANGFSAGFFGTGLDKVDTYYGRLFSGFTVPSGTYTDTITITLNF